MECFGFKRTFAQRIVGVAPHKFLLHILSDTQATRAFLEDTPFIFERFGQFHGAVFASGEMPLTLDVLREINKQHFHARHVYAGGLSVFSGYGGR